MIVEMRIYTVKPGAVGEFMKIYEQHGLQIQLEILGNLVGWYTNEVGDINEVIHMWGYDSFEDRIKRSHGARRWRRIPDGRPTSRA